MKKAIVAALLIGSTGTCFAQDKMREAALEMQAGQNFAQKLVQNAFTTGKTGNVFLTYNGAHAVASSMAFAGWHVHQPTRFMVSGVLKKDGTADTIKPIQAIVVAQTGETAVQQFSQTARRDSPGYSLFAGRDAGLTSARGGPLRKLNPTLKIKAERSNSLGRVHTI